MSSCPTAPSSEHPPKRAKVGEVGPGSQPSAGATPGLAAAQGRPAWRDAIKDEFERRALQAEQGSASGVKFPLAMQAFGPEEALAMCDVVLSGKLTLGEQIAAAEKEFAEKLQVPYAVMVNSGSSANLLAVSAIVNNPQRGAGRFCMPGDSVLVPSVCWSTSVSPLLQLGLKPVFVDVDPVTFNVDERELERRMSPKVRAAVMVHVLGNSCNMATFERFLLKYPEVMLVEDTCESLGSFYESIVPQGMNIRKFQTLGASESASEISSAPRKRMLGTIGDFGTYSFYFSHHITSGEGGMVVCHTLEDYNFLRALRAHGWTRHMTPEVKTDTEAAFPNIDARFLFVHNGYNLRPLEVQGAMVRVQLEKLDQFNENRRENYRRIAQALERHPSGVFGKAFGLMKPAEGTDPAWFGVAMLLRRGYAHQHQAFIDYLNRAGVENRPIISGNFLRQPCLRLVTATGAACDDRAEEFPGAEVIHKQGLFIGIHQILLSSEAVADLVEILVGFTWRRREIVLVTGAGGMLGQHIRHLVATEASDRFQWVFTSRADCDLADVDQVGQLFKRHLPTVVLHCAASLASIKTMSQHPVEFWTRNVTVNNNVLGKAHEFAAWCGKIKVVSVLSTVMFPAQGIVYPVDASAACGGEPHPATEAYAHAKRMLLKLSQWYRQEHGHDFYTVLPGNIYGEWGDFTPATAPLVNALVAKAVEAMSAASSNPCPGPLTLPVMGTGRPLRQIMYAGDLARVMVWSVEHLRDPAPLLVTSQQEYSVREVAETVVDAVAKAFQGAGAAAGAAGAPIQLAFDTDAPDGDLRRTMDLTAFLEAVPDFSFTPLAEGIANCVSYYRALARTAG